MYHSRLLLATLATLGVLASLPVRAASGDVSSIALRDFNRNGKIDRAVVTFANPSNAAWSVRGVSGLSITYQGMPLTISDVFLASTANPAVLEVVLDESQAALPVDTSSEAFELAYRRVGAANGVSDGTNELSAIASGDTGAGDTELDQAAPILAGSTPEPGAVDVLRAENLTLTFSEPIRAESVVITSSVNPGGWLLSTIGKSVSVQHDAYPRTANETFGVTASDMAGNTLVTNGYPNPFSFQTSSDNTPNPRIDPVFQLTSPAAGGAIQAGEATIVAWYANMPNIATIRLSYSTDGGNTWNAIADVPAAQKAYVWYSPNLGGLVSMKAEARDADGGFVNISTLSGLTVAGNLAQTPLRAVSAVEVAQPTASTATLLLRLERSPSSIRLSCNDGEVNAPVTVSGDRPARLVAHLSNLAAGTAYACMFVATGATNASVAFPVPTFVAGDDAKAPDIIGAAVIDQFDAAAGTARLSWTTNEASTASVQYGPHLDYGGLAADNVLRADHAVTLTGLEPGKLHQARITSIDAKGNAGVSKDWYFVFLREGDLIKGSGAAVYWYKGGKRYAFPHLDTYQSWFGNDFSKVIRVPDTQLGAIALGGNVTMKEGVYLIKIQSDPKTYAVEPSAVLRWIQTEEQARSLYGAAWAARVRDIDVSLFTDYTIGNPL